MKSFSDSLLNEILINKKNNYTDNFDEYMKLDGCFNRNLPEETFLTRILDNRIPINPHNPQLKIQRSLKQCLSPKLFYKNIITQFKNMSLLYDLLSDQASKEVMLKILAYRILGFTKVKLPRNNPAYWADLKKADALDVGHSEIKVKFNDFTLNFLDLSPIGYNIKLNIIPAGAAVIFGQRQYEYHGSNFVCKAEKDDVVLDGGACWGDTSLYFAHEVGEKGKVYSFEFMPESVSVFNHNVNHNLHLANTIQLIENPLWNISDEDLNYTDCGPGTHIYKSQDEKNTHICKTISIDDFVERSNIKKVNFIKMDIEGSELNALHGAANTIKKFRPKLAISLYHKPDDFITIPQYLNDLNLGYKFYLDHHTIHVWETVLFAVPQH